MQYDTRYVFWLGAGASKASGCPLGSELIDYANTIREAELDGEFMRDAVDVEKIVHRVADVNSRAFLDRNNIEDILSYIHACQSMGISPFADWPADRDRDLEVVSRLIIRVLEYSQWYTLLPDRRIHVPGYSELVKYVHKNILSYHGVFEARSRDVAFITTNYDMGLEVAMLGMEPVGHSAYDCVAHPRTAFDKVLYEKCGYRIHKLHGSLSWTSSEAWVEENHRRPLVAERLVSIVQSLTASKFRCSWISGSIDARAIVVPTKYKFDNLNKLRTVWRDAFGDMVSANVICVIGYSFPVADPAVRELWRASLSQNKNLRQIVFCDPAYADASLASHYVKKLFEFVNEKEFSHKAWLLPCSFPQCLDFLKVGSSRRSFNSDSLREYKAKTLAEIGVA